MIINRLLAILILFLGGIAFVNAQSPALFSFGNTSVPADEFMRVYEKSNKEKVYSETALRDYLNLYTNFKLKVQDAEDDGLDTLIQVRRELQKYQNQLMESYFDKAVTNTLVEKTYERMKENVKVRHIFVAMDQSVPNEDTAKYRMKIEAARTRVVSGGDFALIAEEVSEDPSAKYNKGLLGWVSAGSLPIVEFEDVAYQTPVGRVSNIFKSNLGYHFLKVEGRRQNPGIMEAAHIFFKFKTDKPTDSEIRNLKKVADSIYMTLVNGASFETTAENWSDDKTSHTNGGKLPKFASGRNVIEFEDAAFALRNDGDISRPVQTIYGFHIIKRLGREPIQSYDELKNSLRTQVVKGSTYRAKKEGHMDHYAEKGNMKEFPQNLDRFIAAQDSSLLRTVWKARFTNGDRSPLITIGGRVHTVAEFGDFLELNQRNVRAATIESMVRRAYNAWRENRIMDYSFHVEDPAYTPLMKEYRDGILLFEQTERKVWSKAMRDTMGLINFYNDNMAQYGGTEKITWKKNATQEQALITKVANAKLYICTDKFIAKQVRKDARKGKSNSEIKRKYNIAGLNSVSIETGAFPEGRSPAVDGYWQVGTSKPVFSDGRYIVVQITNFSEIRTTNNPTADLDINFPQNFNDKKGFIIGDYQKSLEDAWVKQLRKKYPVTVNDQVLRSLVK